MGRGIVILVKPKKHRYIIVFDREEDGRHIASVPGVPGCHAYGRTRKEALDRARAALRFYVREARKQGRRLPAQAGSSIAEVEIVA